MPDEVEPRVVSSDVADTLRRCIMPDIDGMGDTVAAIASRANTPEETVLRVMQGRWKTINLDLADRLLLACGHHISEVTLVWPDD